MNLPRIALLVYSLFSLTRILFCADPAASKQNDGGSQPSLLRLLDGTVSKSELASVFVHPIQCDSDGYIYLMGDIDGTSGIRKLSPKGQRVATFTSTSAPELQVSLAAYFALGADGNVYQLAYLRDKFDRAILIYNKDGSYRAGIKLETPRGAKDWFPEQIAAFPSGDLLIAGTVPEPNSAVRAPFTGIFDQNGTLKREISLADDAELQKMAESGDPRVIAPGHESSNRAIDSGHAEPAEDGNIYIMRRLTPTILYAVSPGGEVVRRFTVNPGDADFTPILIHIAGNRIALEFWNPKVERD